MFRLPSHWSAPEVIEDEIVADEVTIRRAGLSSLSKTGEEVVGSAADVVASIPTARRAWFELLERISGIEAIRNESRPAFDLFDTNRLKLGAREHGLLFPTSTSKAWRFAQSNGLALHSTWKWACDRAYWELAERDRILRSWHGLIRPECLEVVRAGMARSRYDWRVVSFPDHDKGFSSELHVIGVFGFPSKDRPEDPFVLGFAGRPERENAILAATAEARQLLAFLWGEPLPTELAADATGPMQHLDAFQIRGAHEKVRAWLEGAHLQYGHRAASSARSVTNEENEKIHFVDLSPDWLSPDLRVAKAICDRAMPLTFGRSPLSEHLPYDLQLHPLP